MSDPKGGEGRFQIGSNSAKYSNDFFSETTGQILMKHGRNDHLVALNLVNENREWPNVYAIWSQ